MCSPCLQTLGSVEKQLLDYDKKVNKDEANDMNIKEWNKSDLHSKYIGRIVKNNLHDFGYYLQIGKSSYLYEGALYCNRFEGYGNITYSNCTYFEGLFKDNKKFGPGILTDMNCFQEVAWWNGSQIIRLIQYVLPNTIPKLKISDNEKNIKNNISEGKTAQLMRLLGNSSKILDQLQYLYSNNVRNPKSNFFNFELYDSVAMYSEEIRADFNNCFRERIPEIEGEFSEMIEYEDTISSIFEKVDDFSDTIMSDESKDDIICSTFTSEEINLIKIKKKLRHYGEVIESIDGGFDRNNIDVYYAVANSDLLEEMAAHAFHHRDCTSNISFSVRAFLKGLRWDFLKPGINESACVAFLYRCAEGKTLEAAKLYQRFNLNPDVCDANGNSGLLYAAINIQHNIVIMLCNYGADMNFINDNGITSLELVILKYLAVYHDLDDWNYAFLNIKNENQEVGAGEHEKNFNLDYSEYCNSIFFESDKEFYFYDTYKKYTCEYEIGEIECPLKMANKFLFNLDLVKKKKTKKSKKKEKGKAGTKKGKTAPKKGNKNTKKGKTKKEIILESKSTRSGSTQRFNECKKGILLDIFKMISTLLQLGADPNIGTFPMPLLFMSLFLDTPDLLLLLLEYKANPRVIWKKDGMSALHVLASQSRSIETIYGMGKILIEHGVHLNARVNDTHWSQEKRAIIGNYKQEEIVDEGKTVLHILAIREDLADDLDGYLSKLVQSLIKAGTSVKKKYLGHTPLSLSVLRGNTIMARILLENGAKADEYLRYNMGKAVTIYSLLRYEKNLPDIETCKKTLDILMNYDNILAPILEFGNVIEFCQAEETSATKGKKTKKTQKSKKGAKNSIRIMVGQYLLKSSNTLIIKHYQGIILLNLLYYAKTSSLESDNFFKNIVHFVSFEDAFKIMIKLVHLNFIDLTKEKHYSLVLQVLQFVTRNGYTGKKAKKVMADTEIEKKLNHLKSRYSYKRNISVHIEHENHKKRQSREVSFKCPKGIEPELDTDFSKYEVCFNCIQRSNKVLLPCPVCGLVYFCSEQCNKKSNRKNKYHKCKLLYYKKEYLNLQRLLRNGEEYVGVNVGMLVPGEELIKSIKCNKTFDDYK